MDFAGNTNFVRKTVLYDPTTFLQILCNTHDIPQCKVHADKHICSGLLFFGADTSDAKMWYGTSERCRSHDTSLCSSRKHFASEVWAVRVDKAFFDLPTLELAVQLLGKELTLDGVGGYIVEVEAYMGPHDRAAHTYGGRRTPRTEVMFGPPGRAYVYTIHGHHCMNVVSNQVGSPEAVLIRALEPTRGIEKMIERRGRPDHLTDGPGKLCQALGITREHNGWDFLESPLRIADGIPVKTVAVGTRIGIDNTGEARDYPWRFWVEGNEHVSRPRRALKTFQL